MVHLENRRVTVRPAPLYRAAAAVACAVALGAAGRPAGAVVLPTPVVTAAAQEFSPQYTAQNAVDGTAADYASAGQGVNTFIDFSFGTPQSFDKIVVINRDSGGASDWIGDFTLTLDGGATTSVAR